MVLCAGRGGRLGGLTETIPKTLLEVDGGWTILDCALSTLAAAGTTQVRLVVGHAADVVARRVTKMETAHGVTVSLVENPHHASRNNAYSLSLGLVGLEGDLLVVNGDTLFESGVVARLVTAPPTPVTLAVDRVKHLGEEEMKVRFDGTGSLMAISKHLDAATVDGEYIGLARVSRSAIAGLGAALDRVWSRDPALYYEDAFGDLATSGGVVTMVDVGDLQWMEVDTPEDLERARMMSWRS